MARQPAVNTRKSPKQERAKETIQVLIKATAQFLQKHDYDSLSTNKIAEVAGVSIGTLYQYFPTKEALVVALVNQQFEEDFERIRRLLEESAIGSLAEGVALIVRATLSLFSEQTQLRLVVFEQSRRLSLTKSKQTFQQRIRTLLIENYEKHCDNKIQKPTELSTYVVTSAVVGSLMAAASEHPEYLKSAKFENEIVKLIMGYYVGGPETKERK